MKLELTLLTHILTSVRNKEKELEMSAATIIAILQVLMGFVGQIPELVTAVETAIGLLQSNTAPTADQQAQIDAGLAAAHAALQAT